MNKESIVLFRATLPVLLFQRFVNETALIVLARNLIATLKILKKSMLFQFNLLTAISGVDYYNSDYRFNVTYELLSLKYNSRIRVKIFLQPLESVNSIVMLFKNANWWEREVWDLFGIFFNNHPDLRRILLDYGFEGHPMRKDYPVYGYTEIFYDISDKRIRVIPIELAQEYRAFSFDTPW
jgi:NADH/F420H2 dehydrogenase subunit C